jgi:hypothetical protein
MSSSDVPVPPRPSCSSSLSTVLDVRWTTGIPPPGFRRIRGDSSFSPSGWLMDLRSWGRLDLRLELE